MTSEFGSSGDPRRTLALLWGTRGTPTRGPKPGLSVERIVAAAVALADAEGLAALSMRRVAEALGVGTMSLYTYVPGKEELLDVMLDTVVAETEQGGGDDDGDWRARLERIARANRALFAAHPWLLDVASVRPVVGPNVMAKYDRELRAVDGIGLGDVEMDAVLGTRARARRGRRAPCAREGPGRAADGHVRGRVVGRLRARARRAGGLLALPDGARVGAAAGEAHGAYDPDHAFEFGLARVLDGIDALVRARAEGR